MAVMTSMITCCVPKHCTTPVLFYQETGKERIALKYNQAIKKFRQQLKITDLANAVSMLKDKDGMAYGDIRVSYTMLLEISNDGGLQVLA